MAKKAKKNENWLRDEVVETVRKAMREAFRPLRDDEYLEALDIIACDIVAMEAAKNEETGNDENDESD